VVQGNIETGRRNYKKLFEGLEAALNRNASLWGYERPVSGRPAEPLKEAGASSFKLHLLGQMPKGSDLHIPVALENMISVHPGLRYPDFYKAIAESVCLTLILLCSFAGDAGTDSSVPILLRKQGRGTARLCSEWAIL
jgi:hypothetical protein